MGFLRLMNPRSSWRFFEEMKPRGLPGNLKRLMLFGIFTFLGFFLLYSVLGFHMEFGYGPFSSSVSAYYAVSDGLVLALLEYIKWVAVPILIGAVFSLTSRSVVKRKVPMDEAITIMAYAFTPALILNILVAFSLTGVFASSIGGLYAAVLVYCAAKARFKEDWMKAFLLYAVTGMATFFIAGLAMGAMTPVMEPTDEFTLVSEGFALSFSGGEEDEREGYVFWLDAEDIAKRDEQYSDCRLESGRIERDDCYMHVAWSWDYPIACDAIVDQYLRDDCFEDVALEVEDPALCGKISYLEDRDYCYADLAEILQRPAICSNVADPETREYCNDWATSY